MAPFAADRDSNSSKKGAAGVATPRRRDPQEADPMGSTNTTRSHRLLETTDAELVEAAERMDAGLRLVVPMLFDGLGPDPGSGPTERLSADAVPAIRIDDAVIGRAADKMAELRDEAARELRHLDKHAPRHIHVEALAVVAQFDEFLGAVRTYFMEQS
jgi:hypothetical protein